MRAKFVENIIADVDAAFCRGFTFEDSDGTALNIVYQNWRKKQ